MTTINVTEARKNLYSLINKAHEAHDPILITGKKSNAVLIPEDDWLAIQETMYLLSQPDLRESIIKGLQTPLEECEEEIKW